MHTHSTTFTCPMHPEVIQDQPGSCPKCGMALEATIPAPILDEQWVCPMHPEIRQDQPGPCPKCGMALEAEAVSSSAAQWTCPMHPE
ncbi:MAG: hypothetical protein N2C12_14165, partial [Planctomycetales bacterium]